MKSIFTGSGFAFSGSTWQAGATFESNPALPRKGETVRRPKVRVFATFAMTIGRPLSVCLLAFALFLGPAWSRPVVRSIRSTHGKQPTYPPYCPWMTDSIIGRAKSHSFLIAILPFRVISFVTVAQSLIVSCESMQPRRASLSLSISTRTAVVRAA